MTTLPAEPSFIDRDPAVLTADLVARFEAETGRQLLPGQPERRFINVMAYLATLLRINVQEAMKQNLVAYAAGPALEHLGLEVGCPRLGASPALTKLRFALLAPATADKVISAGRRVKTKDGAVTFATTQALVIPRGSQVGEVAAAALTLGTSGNGYQAGDVSVLVDAVDGLDAVMNITETSDGLDPEDDDRLRLRIMNAPEQYSVAGSAGAYRYHAMSASADISDVAVAMSAPGVVSVWPLTRSGLPDVAMLQKVRAQLSGETVRPLCDEVLVLSPEAVTKAVVATVTVYRTADAAAVLSAAKFGAEAYRQDRRAGLGRDLVSSQMIGALQVDGVYRVTLDGWADQELAPNQWADIAIEVQLAGLADG